MKNIIAPTLVLTYLVERLAELGRHLDHLRELAFTNTSPSTSIASPTR